MWNVRNISALSLPISSSLKNKRRSSILLFSWEVELNDGWHFGIILFFLCSSQARLWGPSQACAVGLVGALGCAVSIRRHLDVIKRISSIAFVACGPSSGTFMVNPFTPHQTCSSVLSRPSWCTEMLHAFGLQRRLRWTWTSGWSQEILSQYDEYWLVCLLMGSVVCSEFLSNRYTHRNAHDRFLRLITGFKSFISDSVPNHPITTWPWLTVALPSQLFTTFTPPTITTPLSHRGLKWNVSVLQEF